MAPLPGYCRLARITGPTGPAQVPRGEAAADLRRWA
jgi:hypothetical protein